MLAMTEAIKKQSIIQNPLEGALNWICFRNLTEPCASWEQDGHDLQICSFEEKTWFLENHAVRKKLCLWRA